MFKDNPYGVHGTVTIDKVVDSAVEAAVRAKLEELTKDQKFDTSGKLQIDNITPIGKTKIQVDFEIV